MQALACRHTTQTQRQRRVDVIARSYLEAVVLGARQQEILSAGSKPHGGDLSRRVCMIAPAALEAAALQTLSCVAPLKRQVEHACSLCCCTVASIRMGVPAVNNFTCDAHSALRLCLNHRTHATDTSCEVYRYSMLRITLHQTGCRSLHERSPQIAAMRPRHLLHLDALRECRRWRACLVGVQISQGVGTGSGPHVPQLTKGWTPETWHRSRCHSRVPYAYQQTAFVGLQCRLYCWRQGYEGPTSIGNKWSMADGTPVAACPEQHLRPKRVQNLRHSLSRIKHKFRTRVRQSSMSCLLTSRHPLSWRMLCPNAKRPGAA